MIRFQAGELSLRFWPLCLVGSIGLALSASAQDFERTGPKVPPASRAAASLPAGEAPAAQADSTQLLPRLRGLVFVPSSAAVAAGGSSKKGLVTQGLDLLERLEFRKVAEPFLGQPLTLGGLNALVRQTVLYYRAQNHPVVDVVVPEQDITSGTVQLVVIEGRVGTLKAEGNRWFSSRSIEGQVRLHPGDRIDARRLLEDIDWLNQNPFRSTDVVFAPGAKSGQTEVTLRVQDRFPLRVYAGYENTGNSLIGENRWFTGFNWGNAFGWDDQLNYQFSASDDVEGLVAHSGSYLATLPWRHKLLIFGVHSTSEAQVAPLNIESGGDQLSARYIVPLPKLTHDAEWSFEHEFSLGFDWKRSDNFLEFDVITASDTTTDVGQWVFGYSASLRDPWGAWNLRADLYYSPGDWFPHQTKEDYETARAGASTRYVYGQIQLGRVTRLPWSFTLSNEFTWQVSDSNLLPSEQLALGGYYSVRGYDERALADADSGFIMRHELRAPALKLVGRLGTDPRVQDQVQFLVFSDYGVAKPHSPLPGEDSSTVLASVGVGVRYTLSQYLTVRADYGVPLTDASDPDSGGRWHVGVTVSY